MKTASQATGLPGTAQPIPFRRDDGDVVMHGWGSLLVAALLLAVAVTVLRAVKRRGLLARWVAFPTEAAINGAGISLERSLRLSTKTTVHVLREGRNRHLLIESSVRTRIVACPAQATDEEASG